MHRLHFHAGEIEEYAGGQDHVVGVAEVREESPVSSAICIGLPIAT